MNKQIIKFLQLIGLDILKVIGAIVGIIVIAFIFGVILHCVFEYTAYSFSIVGLAIVIIMLYNWLSSKWKIAKNYK